LNDNFENLLYQAGLTAQGCWDELDDYAREAIVQFGHLIVQDCIQVVHQQDRIPKEFLYAKPAHVHDCRHYSTLVNEKNWRKFKRKTCINYTKQ
jgi:hypothetical protein